jgi:hypothetical protein
LIKGLFVVVVVVCILDVFMLLVGAEAMCGDINIFPDRKKELTHNRASSLISTWVHI